MKFINSILLFLLVVAAGCNKSANQLIEADLIIKNGTIINLAECGKNINDITNKAILINADTISGIIDSDRIPPGQKNVIDATGKFIMPGLTDGFAVINNQSYANAFLYMGVTDIIGVESERRGKFYHNSNPSPNVHMLREVGEEPVSDRAVIDTIAKHAKNGAEILLIMYGLKPSQVKLAQKEAKKYKMGTIGELGFASYREGMDIGVNAFVHTTRYSLDIAPDSLARKVAAHPFSNDMGSAKWQYYKLLSELDSTNERLIGHAENIGRSGSFVQPTFALLYLDMPFSKNPWKEKISKIINISDINRPADKITGKHNYPSGELAAYRQLALQQLMIERTYYKHGAKYLAGSATDVWGTMPGISLHQELEVLHRTGLSNREVLAAGTSNFSDAYGFKFGRIEKGFKANILILDKNPLKDIKNLKEDKIIILNGKKVNLEKLLQIN